MSIGELAQPDRPDAARPQTTWIGRAARAAAAAGVAVLLVASYRHVRTPTAQLGDFGAYYRAGRYVAAGQTPYQLDPKYREQGAYMYCPAFAQAVCRPLAALSYVNAMRAFLAVNWLATAGVVWLSLHLAGPGWRLRPAPAAPGFWVGLIACASVGMYLWSDLHNGQVGTLLLLACLGWITLTLAGRPALGGIALSVAVGLKIYPLLLGPYLLLHRRWWPGLIGLAVGLAVQFVVPVIVLGGRGGVPLHREWLAFCLRTQVPEQTYRAGNESLLGVLARTPGVSDGWHLFAPARLVTLQHAYPFVVVILSMAVYAWVAARRPEPPAAVAVLLVWVTLAAPRAWTFNLAAELPAAVLLAAVVVGRRRRWPWAAVALAWPVYAVAFPTNSLRTPTRWTLGTQFLYDKHFVAALVLAVAVAALCSRPKGLPHDPRD